MTTFRSIECKCAICGKTSKFRVLTSTNSEGGPDLDTRPAEMYRSTMSLWLQECPRCKYVSSDISKEHDISREFLKSMSYRWCDGLFFMPFLAKRFYRHYLIAVEEGNREEAFYAILHCAWACDDKKDKRNAIRCRNLALPLINRMIVNCSIDDLPDIIRRRLNLSNNDNLKLLKADLMRRSKLFNEMIDEFSSVDFKDERMNDYLQFELEKAKIKDSKCYCTDDVPFSKPQNTDQRRQRVSLGEI